MLNAITLSQIYVLDQQEALDFYVGKLGLEVKNDIDMGFMRWLTVSIPGDPKREILLEVPGPPAMDPATAEQVREMVTKGATGGWIGFTCNDIYALYETLKARGVEFTQEPVERFYGIDCGLRDPFGNSIRISQMKPGF
jgi:catechol 2,3-dioxygenase-like lactoylglutathione lyase family enzyme